MSLNLCILPLATIENFVAQKCLLPKEKFPLTARPGQWAKCYFHEWDNIAQLNYAVCQIFPREGDTVCFIDTCVCGVPNNDDGKQMILDKLEVLEAEVTKLTKIDVIFHLNAEYIVNNNNSFTLSYLTDLVQILLQKYHLTKNCIITDMELKEYGIDSISSHIDEAEKENGTFIITDNTCINIENVLLSSKPLAKDLIVFNESPYQQGLQDLNDLMEVLKMQRKEKPKFCLNLNILLVGAVGCGKTILVEDFLRCHRCNVFRICTGNVMKQYPGETEAELRKIFTAASHFEKTFKSLEPTVILLEDLHLLCPQTKISANNSEALANSLRTTAQLLALIDELFVTKTEIMCIATSSNPDNLNELARRPGRFEREIYIGTLQEKERKTIFQELFKQSKPNVEIPPLLLKQVAKQTQGYVIADLALLVRNVAHVILTKPQDSFELVLRECLKKSKPISLRGSDVTAYRTAETFATIGGMFQLKKLLEVSVLAGLKKQESFLRFGLSLPKGVLLYGPPGCAKTTIAKCLATEANMTFIATSGAEVYSPYVGCAEKFIAKIFDTARKNSPCLIFLDEIDSLVGRRSLATSSNSSEVQMRILSTLLTEMDGVIDSPLFMSQNAHILVVAATNRPDMVDDALMRPGRFDKLIHVPAPDLLSRRSILALHEKRMPFAKDLNLDSIAGRTENYSGADICNLCNEAAMQAFQRDFNSIEILNEDFENVFTSTKSSLTKNQIDWYYEFENKFLR